MLVPGLDSLPILADCDHPVSEMFLNEWGERIRAGHALVPIVREPTHAVLLKKCANLRRVHLVLTPAFLLSNLNLADDPPVQVTKLEFVIKASVVLERLHRRAVKILLLAVKREQRGLEVSIGYLAVGKTFNATLERQKQIYCHLLPLSRLQEHQLLPTNFQIVCLKTSEEKRNSVQISIPYLKVHLEYKYSLLVGNYSRKEAKCQLLWGCFLSVGDRGLEPPASRSQTARSTN